MKTIVVSVQNGLLAEGIIRTLKESGRPMRFPSVPRKKTAPRTNEGAPVPEGPWGLRLFCGNALPGQTAGNSGPVNSGGP